MGLTREDFLRLLPVAVGHAPWRMEGNTIESQGTDPAWRIGLETRAGRSFGSVTLPVLAVTLELPQAPQAERAAFRDRFLLGYQRAGG
jgi:hypothetical protein